MKRLVGVFVVLVCAAGFFAAQIAAQNQKPRIGVLLPLTGVSEALGLEVQAIIRRKMGDAVELVIEDTQSRPEIAIVGMQKLVEQQVGLVIGPLNASELEASLNASQRLPVISLVNASPSIAENARRAGAVTFTQPLAQLRSVSDAIGGNSKFLVMSTPFFAFKNDVIESSLPKKDIKSISKTTIVLNQPNTITGPAKESAQSNVVIAAAADSGTAQVLLQSLKAQEGKGVIVSPPPVLRTASVAADLALAWARQPNRSPASWSEMVASSPLYNRSTGTLEVNWSIATRGVSYDPSRSTTGTTPCSCASKDGRVTKKTECKDPPEKCEVKQQEDDCTCNCK